ncbi:MAG: hypothetical protein GY862_03150 [Gammaproteobacteria bacterium]|nr:hypothetical protein [Gammaproteobacteria bacterium]
MNKRPGVAEISNGLAYILRHAWLWPLRFWLRPLAVIRDVEDNDRNEWEVFATALLGGLAWGTAGGVPLWLLTDNPHAIWVLAVAFAVAVAFVVAAAFDSAVAVAVVGVGAVAVAVAGAVAVAVAGTFAVAGFAAGFVAGTDGFERLLKIALTGFIISFFIGILIGIWLPESWTYGLFLSVFLAFAVFWLWLAVDNAHELDIPDWGKITSFFIWIIGCALAASALLPTTYVSVPDTWVWGGSLFFALSFGIITGFFDEMWSELKEKNLAVYSHKQIFYSLIFWVFSPALALVAWWLDPVHPGLDAKLEILVFFLLLVPIIFTGLWLYPLMALISLWQRFSLPPLEKFLPMQWQTFAYPLPGCSGYILKLAGRDGMEAAFDAIQTLQLYSLQVAGTRRAAVHLAGRADTALTFCGQAAVCANARTLAPFSITGAAGRAVAILARKTKDENEQPLRLYVGDFPPKSKGIHFMERGEAKKSWQETFEQMRADKLRERLNHALNELKECTDFALAEEFQSLLEAMRVHIEIEHPAQSKKLSDIAFGKPEKNWLAGGWRCLGILNENLRNLEEYRGYTDPKTRREFLRDKITRLKEQKWKDLPGYWAAIGEELSAHWIGLLENEAEQARPWLRLAVELPEQRLETGQQTLLLTVRNVGEVLAQQLLLTPEPVSGLAWMTPQAGAKHLESGKQAQLPLSFHCEAPGQYDFSCVLRAEDLRQRPFAQTFAFRLDIGASGPPYTPPKIQPYAAGEGLGDERYFAGREELLDQLRGVWRQPAGKPSVVLVGQRRIGKTSLLQKIVREGLVDTRLLPVFLDVQSVEDARDFWRSLSKKMWTAWAAGRAESPDFSFDSASPFADFKQWLADLQPRLEGWRFLLLLDEADLLPEIKGGEKLPGFLRALMQGHDYPVLLLFCGTHALKRMGQAYESFLFNTARVHTVSYMSAADAGLVLSKPAQGVLEFAPAILEEAYRLTHGQPLLLQMMGSHLIRAFNAAHAAGKRPGRFVSLNHLRAAADEVVQLEMNSAFENHWNRCDLHTRNLLSVLAWTTPEGSREQIDAEGLAEAFKTWRLSVPRQELLRILEVLREEEILINEGVTYRFAVPLYRRWAAWRQPPERMHRML